jgi:hypothetical protein
MDNDRAAPGNVNLGDELLAQIVELVRSSPLPVHRKLKALVRAGKIGEMYLGPLADESADRSLMSASSLLASQAGI